jgi:hypothetical protein
VPELIKVESGFRIILNRRLVKRETGLATEDTEGTERER